MTGEQDIARLLAAADGDIICGDDGFAVFWPTKNEGAFSAWMLRALADELGRRNGPRAAQMQAFFAESQP